VQPAIRGIQSQGVVANAKHWVDNNQETDRTSVVEVVDERAQFELYYSPFAGAIAADVGSFMCSYNQIQLVGEQSEGKWSCENPLTLERDLKQRLGFKGWVMSDWGATHSMSIVAGLDQVGGHAALRTVTHTPLRAVQHTPRCTAAHAVPGRSLRVPSLHLTRVPMMGTRRRCPDSRS
jgi:beta-glucosidase-like glycosyl hydrolase